MRNKGTFVLAILLAWLLAAHAPLGETSVRGEQRKYRRAAIAFAQENRELLDELAARLEALNPRGDWRFWLDSSNHELILGYGYDQSTSFEDESIRQALLTTPIESIDRDGRGWRFDLEYTSGWLDTCHYYALYYNAPLPMEDWTPLDEGHYCSGDDWVEYCQNLGGGIYYDYLFCW